MYVYWCLTVRGLCRQDIAFIQHVSGLGDIIPVYGSSGNKLNRTSCTAEKGKIAARARIKPATDSADALWDTEILYPILHPVILWCSARAKSLWMGFNLSLFFFLLVKWWKRVGRCDHCGRCRESFTQTNPDMGSDLRVFQVSSWSHCCDMFDESVCACLVVYYKKRWLVREGGDSLWEETVTHRAT